MVILIDAPDDRPSVGAVGLGAVTPRCSPRSTYHYERVSERNSMVKRLKGVPSLNEVARRHSTTPPQKRGRSAVYFEMNLQLLHSVIRFTRPTVRQVDG